MRVRYQYPGTRNQIEEGRVICTKVIDNHIYFLVENENKRFVECRADHCEEIVTDEKIV